MAVSFKGEYNHSIDAKGRLIMPAKFREVLGESFTVTRGFDECLFVFDKEGWSSFEAKLKSLPIDNEEARYLSRFFTSGAMDMEPDKMGRVLIPAKLLKYAGITKEAVIVGVGGRAEIWSLEKWEKATASININDIAAKMSELGLSL